MSAPGESIVHEIAETKGFDMVLAMDATGSMGDELRAACNTLTSTFRTITTKFPTHQFRLAVVIYRDYDDAEPMVVRPFTSDIASVEAFLTMVRPYGGGDAAEDVTGALHEINELDWQGEVRQVLFATDAPCHGRAYYASGVSDYYPDGDREGRNPEHLMTQLAGKNVGFMFFQMNESTKRMTHLFQEAYTAGRVPGSKANFILADVTEQLAHDKAEFGKNARVRREEMYRRMEEDRLMALERRRVEEEAERMARRTAFLENGGKEHEVDKMESEFQAEQEAYRITLSFEDPDRGGCDEDSMYSGLPSMDDMMKVAWEPSPSDGTFSACLLSAVSSQLE